METTSVLTLILWSIPAIPLVIHILWLLFTDGKNPFLEIDRERIRAQGMENDPYSRRIEAILRKHGEN